MCHLPDLTIPFALFLIDRNLHGCTLDTGCFDLNGSGLTNISLMGALFLMKKGIVGAPVIKLSTVASLLMKPSHTVKGLSTRLRFWELGLCCLVVHLAGLRRDAWIAERGRKGPLRGN